MLLQLAYSIYIYIVHSLEITCGESNQMSVLHRGFFPGKTSGSAASVLQAQKLYKSIQLGLRKKSAADSESADDL